MRGKSCMHCTRRATVEKIVAAHYQYFYIDRYGGKAAFSPTPSCTYEGTVYLCDECARLEMKTIENHIK